MKGTIIVHLVNYNIEQIPLIVYITINGINVTTLLNIIILKGFIYM